MLTTLGEWAVIYIPATIAAMVIGFLVLRALTRHGAKVQLTKMRSIHPEAFELFRRHADPRDYEKGSHVDYVKIASHFRHFLETNGVHPFEKSPLR